MSERNPSSGDGPLLTCMGCGASNWTIQRDPDCLVAICGRCRRAYDIGWSTKGYVRA